MWKIIIFALIILGCSTVQKHTTFNVDEHCINNYVKYKCIDPNVGEGWCIKKDAQGSAITCNKWGYDLNDDN